MDKNHIERISAWIIQRGLGGASETELLHGFCQKCQAVGLDLSRALALIDTLHPVYEGRAFRWRNDGVEEEPVLEYGRTQEGEAAANWQRSVFYHMLTTERDEVRLKLGQGETAGFLN
ncbi:MAG: adenylate/guanylate cyclase protein, partial [Microvirga sp.]|nr:adenylate/guanylate cyclase protein [Microvirga sp.]